MSESDAMRAKEGGRKSPLSRVVREWRASLRPPAFRDRRSEAEKAFDALLGQLLLFWSRTTTDGLQACPQWCGLLDSKQVLPKHPCLQMHAPCLPT